MQSTQVIGPMVLVQLAQFAPQDKQELFILYDLLSQLTIVIPEFELKVIEYAVPIASQYPELFASTYPSWQTVA